MERLAGTFLARLDPQGRLVLPRAFRDILRKHSWQRLYWLGRSDGGLLVTPPEVEAREREIREAHPGAWLDDPELQEELASILGALWPTTVDVQGRVRLRDEDVQRLGGSARLVGLGGALDVQPADDKDGEG